MRSDEGDGLFPVGGFAGFGPDRLDPHIARPVCHRVTARRRARLRAQVRHKCPRSPGVYGMVNARGELVYVGKAKCLRARLLSYFRTRSRDPKAGRILEHTRTIAWECSSSEFAALLRELELIRRWRPRFNVQGQPGRHRPTYVCIGRRPAAQVFLARHPPAGVVACFGPVPGGRRAREAVRRLNDVFRLRDCPQAQEFVFAEQAELFPVVRAAGCLRYEIGTCLGPCLGACCRAAYRVQVAAAEAFLAGTDVSLLQNLQQEMTAASAALEFERAAAVRDRLEVLGWLQERLQRLRLARERQAFLYPIQGGDGRGRWYLIQGGRVVVAVAAPATARQRLATLALIRKTYPHEPLPAGPVPADQVDGVFLVAAWFHRHPEERARLMDPDALLHALG
jgi:excinuclease ABC subunit C